MTSTARIRSFAVALALAAVVVSSGSPLRIAQAATGQPTVRFEHTFTVNDAPTGPWDVYLGSSRLMPGFWAGPHTHPGAEYGLVLDGQGARWNDGVLTTVNAVGGFNTSSGIVHESGNVSESEALQLTTHILSAGGPFNVPASPPPPNAPLAKAGATQTQLYRIKFPMAAHPANPFKMTMEVMDFGAGMQTPEHMPPGTLLGVVVDGRMTVTQNGATHTYATGEGFLVPAGTAMTLAAADGAPASIAATVMAQ